MLKYTYIYIYINTYIIRIGVHLSQDYYILSEGFRSKASLATW